MNPISKTNNILRFLEKSGKIHRIKCFIYPDIFSALNAKLVIYSIIKNSIR
jgi:hypothetical protein